MPQIKKIKETMLKKIPQESLNKFDFTGSSDNPADVIALIDKMDELLTKEQCLQIMENQGCCKSGKRKDDCKAFAIKYKDKSLSEKIALMPQIQYMMEPRLNSDGTITVTYGGFQNDVHTGKTTCSCGTIKKLKQPFSVSQTYCGCCAGHFLFHYQIALGVKLKLKEIVSSPLNTNGEKPCSFTFEVTGSNNNP